MLYSAFQWQGINLHGTKIKGTIHAKNSAALKETLKNQDITLIYCKKAYYITNARVSRKEITQFTQDLCLLTHAGILLPDALKLMSNPNALSKIQLITQTLLQKIHSGKQLSEALQSFPEHFDSAYLAIIKSGEITGKLDEALGKLSNHLENQQVLKNKINKALFYPTVVFVISLTITLGLLLFVLPQFQQIFADFNAPLPLFTTLVIKIASIIRKNIFLIFAAITSLSLSYCWLLQQVDTIAKAKDRFVLKIPLAKDIIQKSILARWCMILATMLGSGISLLEALNTANSSITNRFLKQELCKTLGFINTQGSLYFALEKISCFSTRIIKMIQVGEQAGKLDEMLQRVSSVYLFEIDSLLDYLSKLLEPVIMIILAITTGSLILAIYLPVFQMGSLV